jgi:hypothetical protein
MVANNCSQEVQVCHQLQLLLHKAVGRLDTEKKKKLADFLFIIQDVSNIEFRRYGFK